VPFTLCLDVTLRVETVPRAAASAQQLSEEFTILAAEPLGWPFRYLTARSEGEDLVVRARLLEPLDELYGVDVEAHGEDVAPDLVLELLNAHCPAWRSADIGNRRRRRYWTGAAAD